MRIGLQSWRPSDHVDAVRDQLRVVARDGGEGADVDAVGAVDDVLLGDGRMRAHDEGRIAVGAVREMGALRRMAGDPVRAVDDRMRAAFEPAQVDRDVEVADVGAFAHDELAREDVGQADARVVGDLVAPEAAQHPALERPGQQHHASASSFFIGPRLRARRSRAGRPRRSSDAICVERVVRGVVEPEAAHLGAARRGLLDGRGDGRRDRWGRRTPRPRRRSRSSARGRR